MKILVFNAGSSNQKSCLYDVGAVIPEQPPSPLWQCKIEWGERNHFAEFRVSGAQRVVISDRVRVEGRRGAIEQVLRTLWSGPTQVISGPEEIDVAGHRVVHGGREYTQATLVTADLKEAIERLSILAPLHNRAGLDGIEVIEDLLGSVRQVVVFDTAFHSHLPDEAATYPGPYEWLDKGIRRYGFHGISHQYCAERAAQILGRDLDGLRLVTCHLGNGCSLAAVRNGRSVDTTMGFTPLEGLVMGTRAGSVDPGVLLYLLRAGDVTAQQLDEMLNKKSGLLGVSGVSGDMREVLAAAAQGNTRAKLAFRIFAHRLRSSIGSMVAVLGGVDALVFTGGIGENSPQVRAAACANFGFLGLDLDTRKNEEAGADRDIASAGSAVRLLIVRAQEDWAIARECYRLAGG